MRDVEALLRSLLYDTPMYLFHDELFRRAHTRFSLVQLALY